MTPFFKTCDNSIRSEFMGGGNYAMVAKLAFVFSDETKYAWLLASDDSFSVYDVDPFTLEGEDWDDHLIISENFYDCANRDMDTDKIVGFDCGVWTSVAWYAWHLRALHCCDAASLESMDGWRMLPGELTA